MMTIKSGCTYGTGAELCSVARQVTMWPYDKAGNPMGDPVDSTLSLLASHCCEKNRKCARHVSGETEGALGVYGE